MDTYAEDQLADVATQYQAYVETAEIASLADLAAARTEPYHYSAPPVGLTFKH